MTTKTIIVSLVGVILMGSAVYFSMQKQPLSIEATTLPPVQTIRLADSSTTEKNPQKEPTATSSTDEIINYLVDVQPHNETQATQVSLETLTPTAVESPTISTNF
jgi:cytoskeletal protein RodZ